MAVDQTSRLAQGRRVTLFQIYYDDATKRALDPAFTPLDNRANERPDWAEYWPIRRTLAHEHFADDELVGFFSPRFGAKTGLTGQQVLEAIQTHDAEVYSFSPYFEHGVLFQNPFYQGESHHPGLGSTTQQLLPSLGIRADLGTLVCDQTTTIFSNYFVAPGALWRAWSAMAARVFDICEAGRLPVARRLTASATHRGASTYQMKVFVVERLITLLLEATGRSAAWLVDPRQAPRSILNLDLVVDVLLVLESLKRGYRQTGDPDLLRQYRLGNAMVRETLTALAHREAETAGR